MFLIVGSCLTPLSHFSGSLQWTEAVYLDLSGNLLEEFPPSIQYMTNLDVLDISGRFPVHFLIPIEVVSQ